MPISFYEEEEEFEYSEGMELITEYMDTESTTLPVTLSEGTRNVAIQKAVVSNRPPSPMDVDSGDHTMESLCNRHTAGPFPFSSRSTMAVGPGIAPTKQAPTVPVRPAAPSPALPVSHSKPTDTKGPATAPVISPGAIPQPTKRQPTGTKPRKPSRTAEAPEFGTELEPFIIAHDKTVQALLDEHDLAWGTVYEIARGISKQGWQWSSVSKEKVALLCGSNAAAAPKVASVIKGIRHEHTRGAAADVWAEYDREQDAIVENKGRGLGGMGAWEGKDGWYGGRIQQVGRLVWSETEKRLTIELEKPEIRRSHRFSRFLGSRRILQLRVTDKLMYGHGNDVRHLLSSRRFIICGRVFLPFHAKEGSAYLLETKENYERGRCSKGDEFRLSLREFVQWHNPLHLNHDQPISKWSTRWALGLSTSVPTIVFEPQYIFYIDDEYVTPRDWEGKAPAEKVLTDGCGFINGAALTQILRVMKYGSRPTAVQGRIGGSKGMWVLHPDPQEQFPDGPAKIWIRPSQLKIKLGSLSELGVAQRMFDLLAPSRMTSPSRLSSQTLVNLSYNKVSHQVLKELMAQGLREEIQPFIQWDQPHSMIMVWKAVERAGKVAVGRLRRILAGQARALGLGQLRPAENQDPEDEDDEDEVELNQFQVAASSSHKKYSGQPLTLHETVLELLQAGFHPKESELLFKKLENVVTLVLDEYVEKFHIPVLESCEAYIVPDPYGVLEENQIHFRSSEPFISPSTGEQSDIILGDVLVSRNPTRLPSDIQKVKAVAHPKLSNYFNVIVFPIKGKQSLASYLGGGDYDGDTVMVNWYKPLVDQFRGSPLSNSPNNLFDSFEREVEKVRHFDQRVTNLELQEAQEAFQKVLLLGLAETRVGLYSKFQDAAVYELGYRSQESIRLAYMFTTCLDASKTGLRVKLQTFEQDKQKWGGKKPWYAWALEKAKATGNEESKQVPINKRSNPPFILDDLVDEGTKLKKDHLDQYRLQREQSYRKEDKDLSRPWHDAVARAKAARFEGIFGFSDNLEDIEAHIKDAFKKYCDVTGACQKDARVGKSLDSSARNKAYDEVVHRFAGPPKFRGYVYFSDDDVQTLKASCASIQNPNFGFCVAFHRLCTIKARAQTGGHVTVAQQFSQCQTVPNVVARMLSQPLAQDDDV